MDTHRRIRSLQFKFSGPAKKLPQGIMCMSLTETDNINDLMILVGSGNGRISLLGAKDLKEHKYAPTPSAILLAPAAFPVFGTQPPPPFGHAFVRVHPPFTPP